LSLSPDSSAIINNPNTNKGNAMFLLRIIFCLVVVIMLIPTGHQRENNLASDENKDLSVNGAIGAATATVSDMAGFCDRNQQTCKIGSAAFELFLAKAENGARLALEAFSGSEDPSPENNNRSHEIHLDRNTPNVGTLRESDLKPTWRGPGTGRI
jgi:hypothetical protein